MELNALAPEGNVANMGVTRGFLETSGPHLSARPWWF